MNSEITIFIGAVVISLLHGLIPSHWLPIVAIARKEKWTLAQTFGLTLKAGLAHSLSTVMIGVIIAFIGIQINEKMEIITQSVSAGILILLGVWFLFRHYHHHHFHIDDPGKISRKKLAITILAAMFFSPCLEITGFFLTLGKLGWLYIAFLSFSYVAITLLSMTLWVYIGYAGLKKLNSHKWEHNSGIITGIIMIMCGLLMIVFH